VHQVGANLGQGNEDEGPLLQTGMGDHNLRRLYDEVAIKKDVDVDGARGVAKAGLTAQCNLDAFDYRQQLEGTNFGGSAANGVEKKGLLLVTQRSGLIKRGYSLQGKPLAQEMERIQQI
jgi:hypothetical protein